MKSPYSAVPYTGHPFAQTHPRRLAAIAKLFGLSAPAIETCRVLELGCGDGGNLTPMAESMPHARFTGIDLAEPAIQAGTQIISDLGLRNITLLAADLLTLDASYGEFDYIITHGLYSWCPAEVRERILQISHDHLSRDGVAFVSYNALPGSRIRQMLREAMLFQAADFDDPQEKLDQALAMLGFIASAHAGSPTYRQLIAEEIARIRSREPFALFHDELAPIYEPVYFQQFVDHAARHGLQFLGEAEFLDLGETRLSAEAVGTLNEIAGDDRILRQQYIDYACGREFRQTLLIHEARTLDFPPRPENLRGLYASTSALPIGDNEFETPSGAQIRTSDPVPREMMLALVAAAPQALAIADHGFDLPSLLLATLSGIVDLHSSPLPLTTKVSARPQTSPLLRYQLSKELPLTTRTHASLILEDPTDCELLALLDGTRALADLTIPDAPARAQRLARRGVFVE